MLSIENVSLSMGRSYYQKIITILKKNHPNTQCGMAKLKDVLNLQHEVDFKQFDNLLFGYNPDGTKIYLIIQLTKKISRTSHF